MAPEAGRQKVVVVGAGPVGALAALHAAVRGDDVEIYELRGDLRDPSTVPLNFTKSINLALSERGINAMKHAGPKGLLENVLQETIPMSGRMIHGRTALGDLYQNSQAYDVHRRSIYAVDRAGLNKALLDVLEAMPNVTFFFSHKLTGADFKKNKAWFEQDTPSTADTTTGPPGTNEDRAPEIEVSFDLLIGADGAHSAARYHLMKFARVNYQQEYIDTEWCEFNIAPTPESKFAMSPNHLHIWPGKDFMFIAIPSLDRSFTCTFFAPDRTFKTLYDSPDLVLPFFAENFPGVSPELISHSDLLKQFTTTSSRPLIAIKCSPYHFNSSVVILGDAAHAMVPFYGQGMNAGLEDVRVLFDFFDEYKVYSASASDQVTARGKALAAYTTHRAPDASTINDLALKNYYEMRSGVVSPVYLFRKFVEETVSKYFPASGWQTQYSRISFGNQRYSEVVKDVRKQGTVLLGTIGAVLGLGTVTTLGIWVKFGRRGYLDWLWRGRR